MYVGHGPCRRTEMRCLPYCYNHWQVVLNTYNAVQKTFVGQGAAFQGRPEFRLWHGIFAQALDEGAPPTIGSESITLPRARSD